MTAKTEKSKKEQKDVCPNAFHKDGRHHTGYYWGRRGLCVWCCKMREEKDD